MPRYEFSQGSSNKFWEIERSEKSFATTYGKIGTDGQTTIKTFATDAEAQRAYEKLIAEKTSKGYVPVGSTEDIRPQPSRIGIQRVTQSTDPTAPNFVAARPDFVPKSQRLARFPERLRFVARPKRESATAAFERWDRYHLALGQQAAERRRFAIADVTAAITELGAAMTMPASWIALVTGPGIPVIKGEPLLFTPDRLEVGTCVLDFGDLGDRSDFGGEKEIARLESTIAWWQPDEGTCAFWLLRPATGMSHWFDSDLEFKWTKPRELDVVIADWVQADLDQAEANLATGSTPVPSGSWRHP